MTDREYAVDASCTFCAQYVLRTQENFWRQWGQRFGQESDVIIETDQLLVIAGLGALVEGYVLLLPRDHYLSIGALPKDQISEIAKAKGILSSRLRHLYGQIICFEHGMSSFGKAGGCIDHAHIHMIPCDHDFRTYLQSSFPEYKLTNLTELDRFAQATSGYLYYEDSGGSMFVYTPNSQLPSQYLRRMWAQFMERPHEWDWGLYIGEENVAQTINRLRDISSSQLLDSANCVAQCEAGKLVRDKIPEIIRGRGETAQYYSMNEREFGDSLAKKLIEESQEFFESRQIEELVDVYEVLVNLLDVAGISEKHFLQLVEEKRQFSGRFDRKLRLLS
jgi:predicted house-cleaning noncanonical NTP pyrophosphatase (MazG superfamily)/diadenosine tetraphosphate (Ap4A) HIT family hydrolase